MAVIKVENLSVIGSEFFSDHENYLDELSETDSISIKGGWTSVLVISTWALR